MKILHPSLLLALGALAGCDSPTPVSRVLPTAPTPPVAVQQSGVVNVNGYVWDTAQRPIAGAIVEVLDGPQAGRTATSNATGAFAIGGVFEVGTRFRARREGYLDGESRLVRQCEQCSSHWVSFYLGLPIAPADIAGDYTLTISAHEACSALPPEAMTRTYTTRVVPDGTQPTSANTRFRVAMSDASVVRELAWDGLYIFVAGDYLEMWMGDFHGQPGLLERIDTDTYFSMGGGGHTTVAPTAVTTFSSAVEGEIVYCVFKPGIVALDANNRYTCGLDRAVTRAACLSPAHRLTFIRR